MAGATPRVPQRDAARCIWPKIPEEAKYDDQGRQLLMTDEPEATLARWIADFAKGNPPA